MEMGRTEQEMAESGTKSSRGALARARQEDALLLLVRLSGERLNKHTKRHAILKSYNDSTALERRIGESMNDLSTNYADTNFPSTLESRSEQLLAVEI